MRSLVVYYSRTGNTRFAAEKIAEFLDADIEEVVDTVDRTGVIGWLRSGMEAALKAETEIGEVKYFPADYDLVFLGSPVWGRRITPAMRTYLQGFDFSDVEVAFFNTNGSDEDQNTFDTMKALLDGKEAVGKLVLSKVSEDEERSKRKIEEWCDEIRSRLDG